MVPSPPSCRTPRWSPNFCEEVLLWFRGPGFSHIDRTDKPYPTSMDHPAGTLLGLIGCHETPWGRPRRAEAAHASAVAL